MSDPRPFPTEPSSGEEQIRDTGCAEYERCLDTAVRSDWRAFTCQRCPLYTPETARKTAAILRPLRAVSPPPAPRPPPKEPPMPVVPAEPQSAYARAVARKRRVAELEEQLAREKELLRADFAEAEKEMAELREVSAAPAPASGTFRGGKNDEAILAAARKRPVTAEELAGKLGLPLAGQRMRQLEKAGLLRKVARGLYEAVA